MMRFFEVPGALLDDLWSPIEEHLAKVSRYHPFITPQLIYANARSGHTAIVIAVDDERIVAACALEILTFSPRRVANIYALGADEGFLTVLAVAWVWFASWAKQHECQALMITGRRGWVRLLKRIGAQHRECVHGWMEL